MQVILFTNYNFIQSEIAIAELKEYNEFANKEL